MADAYAAFGAQLDSPASNAAAVTPSDDNDLSYTTRALYVGAAGNVTVNMADSGSAIAFVGVTAGSVLPIRAKRVKSTGTTASSIVAIW